MIGFCSIQPVLSNQIDFGYLLLLVFLFTSHIHKPLISLSLLDTAGIMKMSKSPFYKVNHHTLQKSLCKSLRLGMFIWFPCFCTVEIHLVSTPHIHEAEALFHGGSLPRVLERKDTADRPIAPNSYPQHITDVQ